MTTKVFNRRLAGNNHEEGRYGLTAALVRAVRAAVVQNNPDLARELISPLHAADLADLIGRLPGDERHHLITLIDDSISGEVLAFIEDNVRDTIIEQLDARDVAAAISDLDTDDAVSVLEDLDLPQQREILEALLEDADRIGMTESLTYPENTAGRLMPGCRLLSHSGQWKCSRTQSLMPCLQPPSRRHRRNSRSFGWPRLVCTLSSAA